MCRPNRRPCCTPPLPLWTPTPRPARRVKAYPDSHPGGAHLPETGAAEVDTLGYIFFGSQTDAVHHPAFTFPHADPALLLQFSGIGLERLNDESWGIDNVSVSIACITIEPDATLLTQSTMDFSKVPGLRFVNREN